MGESELKLTKDEIILLAAAAGYQSMIPGRGVPAGVRPEVAAVINALGAGERLRDLPGRGLLTEGAATAIMEAIPGTPSYEEAFDSFGKPKAAGKRTDRTSSQTAKRSTKAARLALGVVSRTDLGNAHRVAEHLDGKALHVAGEGWRIWDGTRWALDRRGHALRLAGEALLEILEEAKTASDDERPALVAWARSSLFKQRITAALDLAAGLPNLARVGEDFDALPWHLNTPSGVVDLRTGTLRPHNPGAMHSKITTAMFDPEAAAPVWDAFLERVLPSSALRLFVQRAVGLSLVGEVREHVLFFAHGGGANGKGTTLNTLRAILGDYGMAAAGDLLLRRKNDAHKTELVDLQGVRLAVCQEAGKGRSFDEPKVKVLTGGDFVRANRMHQDNREWSPTHTLWIAANHKPKIHGTDDAIWRRVKLIPFDVQIPAAEQDGGLIGRLLTEGAGILRWAVLGCLAWQQEGLGTPDEVRAATEDYRAQEDTLGDFLADCCVLGPDHTETRKALFEAYRRHAAAAGEEHPMTTRDFTAALREHGIDEGGKQGSGAARTWRGIALTPAWGGIGSKDVPAQSGDRQQETLSGVGAGTSRHHSPTSFSKSPATRNNRQEVPASACVPGSGSTTTVSEVLHRHESASMPMLLSETGRPFDEVLNELDLLSATQTGGFWRLPEARS